MRYEEVFFHDKSATLLHDEKGESWYEYGEKYVKTVPHLALIMLSIHFYSLAVGESLLNG
jgi:hypothetical protein